MTRKQIWREVARRVRSGQQTFVCNALNSLGLDITITPVTRNVENARLQAEKPEPRMRRAAWGGREMYPSSGRLGAVVWYPITKAGKRDRLALCAKLAKDDKVPSPDRAQTGSLTLDPSNQPSAGLLGPTSRGSESPRHLSL